MKNLYILLFVFFNACCTYGNPISFGIPEKEAKVFWSSFDVVQRIYQLGELSKQSVKAGEFSKAYFYIKKSEELVLIHDRVMLKSMVVDDLLHIYEHFNDYKEFLKGINWLIDNLPENKYRSDLKERKKNYVRYHKLNEREVLARPDDSKLQKMYTDIMEKYQHLLKIKIGDSGLAP